MRRLFSLARSCLLLPMLLIGAECAGRQAMANGPSGAPASKAEWMVEYSRRTFEGACACPYDLDRDRTPCGDRSVYAHHGTRGYLFCYVTDVRDDDVKSYVTDSQTPNR